MHEQDAATPYAQQLHVADFNVEVQETGLHLHPHNFIGASPDWIVAVNDDEGFLEVKCPLSQKGKTAEAATQKSFCVNMLEAKCNSSVTTRTTNKCKGRWPSPDASGVTS